MCNSESSRLRNARLAGDGWRSSGVTSIRSRGIDGSVASPIGCGRQPSGSRLRGQERDAEPESDKLDEVGDRVDLACDPPVESRTVAGVVDAGAQ